MNTQEDLSHIKTLRDAHAHVHRKLGWSEDSIKRASAFADANNPEAATLMDKPITTVLRPGATTHDLIKALTMVAVQMQAHFAQSSN